MILKKVYKRVGKRSKWSSKCGSCLEIQNFKLGKQCKQIASPGQEEQFLKELRTQNNTSTRTRNMVQK